MDVQLRRYVLILMLFFLIQFSSTKISDLRLCGDPACKDPISRGRTVLRYLSDDKRILSFLPNKDVIIYGKEAGSRPDLWDVEIDGRRGYVPKKLIQEIGVMKRDLKYKVSTEEDKEEITSNISADLFNEKDQGRHDVLQGKYASGQGRQDVLQGKDASGQEQSERAVHEANRQTRRDSVPAPDFNPSSPTSQSFEASAVPQPAPSLPSMPQQDNSLPMPTQTGDQEGLADSYLPQNAVRTSFSSAESTLAAKTVEQDNSVAQAKFTVIDGTTFPLDEDLILDISTSTSVSHVESPKNEGRVLISPSASLPPSTPDHLPQQNDANWGKAGLDEQPPVRPPESLKDQPPGSAPDEAFSPTIRASPVQHDHQKSETLDNNVSQDNEPNNSDHSDLPGNGEDYADIGAVERIGSYFKNIFGGQDDSDGIPHSQPERDVKQPTEDFNKDSLKFMTDADQTKNEEMQNAHIVEEEKWEQNPHKTLPIDTSDNENVEGSNKVLEVLNEEETKVEVEDALGNLVLDYYASEEKKETVMLQQNEDDSGEQQTHPDTGGLNPNPVHDSVDNEKQSVDEEKSVSFKQDFKLSDGDYHSHGSNGNNHSLDETQGVSPQDQKEEEFIPPFRLAEQSEKLNDISAKGTPFHSTHSADSIHDSLGNDVPESSFLDGTSQKHSVENLSHQENSHKGLSDDGEKTSLKEEKPILEEHEYTSEETTLNNSPVSDHQSKPSSMLKYAISSETGEPVPNQHLLFPDQPHELVDSGGKSLPEKLSSEEKETEETSSTEHQKEVAEEIVEETANVNGETNPKKNMEDEVTGEGYTSEEEAADESIVDETRSEVGGENFTYGEMSNEEDTVDKSNPKEVIGEETIRNVSNSSEDTYEGNSDDETSHQKEEGIFDDKSSPDEKVADNTKVDEITPAEEVVEKFLNNEFNFEGEVVNEARDNDQVESKDNQVPNNKLMSHDREQVDQTDAGNEAVQLKRHDFSDSDTRETAYFNEQEIFSDPLKKELNFGKSGNLGSGVGLNTDPAQSFKEHNNPAFNAPEKKSSNLNPVGAISGSAGMEVNNHLDKLKPQEPYQAKNDPPDSVIDDHKLSTDHAEPTSSTLSEKSNYLDPVGAISGSVGMEVNNHLDKLKPQEPYQAKNDPLDSVIDDHKLSTDHAEPTTSTVSQSRDSLDSISNPLPITTEPSALEESEVRENLKEESGYKKSEKSYCFTDGLDSENDCLHNHNEEHHRGISPTDVPQLQEETTAGTSFTWEDMELLAREYFLSLKRYLQMTIDMLPEPIQAALADLEKNGLSPRVTVFLTIFATSSVLLIISFWLIKRGRKERFYIQKLCSQEKIVFTVSKERDVAKEELEAAKKQITSLEQSWLEQQNAMEPLQQELKKNKVH
ncbi:melanoma inhibitory activity protein 3-like [Limulus polyphemus]|uniref:Melanoma inhibitory activity protein 3-like n=1 Tax=Limulus polyphemus TaxID=6850 RepID=A0ABM1BZD7_LIMPO|nr:melanoma inhibitory activity protein 3-like [Limulus polyphemus]